MRGDHDPRVSLAGAAFCIITFASHEAFAHGPVAYEGLENLAYIVGGVGLGYLAILFGAASLAGWRLTRRTEPDEHLRRLLLHIFGCAACSTMAGVALTGLFIGVVAIYEVDLLHDLHLLAAWLVSLPASAVIVAVGYAVAVRRARARDQKPS